jgi:hypothetical protein
VKSLKEFRRSRRSDAPDGVANCQTSPRAATSGTDGPDWAEAPRRPTDAPEPGPSDSPPPAGPEATRPDVAGRDARTGRFVAGNQQRRTHGLSKSHRQGESPDPGRQAERLAAIVRDLGGAENVSSLQLALAEQASHLLTLAEFLAADHMKRGMLTPRGRLRPTFDAYLKVCDRIDRLVQRLGIDAEKGGSPSPLAEYLSSRSSNA